MSGGAKWFLSLIVLLVLVGGVWYYVSKTKKAPVVATNTTATTTPAVTPTPPVENLITSPDTSDATLSSDLSAIDGQMTVVTADSAAVDASMGDKQVTQ